MEDEMHEGRRRKVTKEDEFKKCKEILQKLRGKQKLAILEDLERIPEKGRGRQVAKSIFISALPSMAPSRPEASVVTTTARPPKKKRDQRRYEEPDSALVANNAYSRGQ